MATYGHLEIADIVVVAVYFFGLIGVGIWASFCNRGSVGGYFLAGRSMNWYLVGASLFASNIGSGHFIGLSGSGAASGIGVALFEISAIYALMLLGWIFVPVYTISGVFTMPEYLKKRFGGSKMQIYLACMTLFLYIFTKISADLYAGAVFIDQALQINLYLSIIILLSISAIFTILGGLTAVIWTDFVQTIIMLVGAIYLMVVSFIKVGGLTNMIEAYFNTVPNTTRTQIGRMILPQQSQSWYQNVSLDWVGQEHELKPNGSQMVHDYTQCGIPPKNAMHFFRSVDDKNLPWTGVMFGLTISNIWYWCTDQVIVQRTLSAKNLSHAKAGCIIAGALKLLPLWLLIFPGMISRILFPDEVGCGDPRICQAVCGKPQGCTDIAYPRLVLKLLPQGARGLMLSVMVASLISSLTSIFNSSSTLFTMDIWRRIRPDAKSAELMIVGRISILILVGISVAWIKVVQESAGLFHYIQSVTSYLAPPVCAVFLLAIFWERCNENGAFAALMVGLVIGLVRFIWESVYPKEQCGEPVVEQSSQFLITKLHYLHFSVVLFLISILVAWIVSLLTAPLPPDYTDKLVYWKRHKGRNWHANKEHTNENQNARVSPKQFNLPKRSWYMRIIYWICGLESNDNDEDEQMETGVNLDIQENPKWKLINDGAAVAILVAAIGLWAFFA